MLASNLIVLYEKNNYLVQNVAISEYFIESSLQNEAFLLSKLKSVCSSLELTPKQNVNTAEPFSIIT